MPKKWIQGAIKRPGQLHRDLGIPKDEKIPQKALQRAIAGDYGEATAKRARLARTLGKMR